MDLQHSWFINIMKILDIFRSHKHYWSAPTRNSDGHNIQICSGCGKDRKVKLQYELKKSELDSEAGVSLALYPLPKERDRAHPPKAK
jgi:hypothetical protein